MSTEQRRTTEAKLSVTPGDQVAGFPEGSKFPTETPRPARLELAVDQHQVLRIPGGPGAER